MSSVKSVKMITLQEPSDDSKKLLPLPQVQDYSWLTLDKSTPTLDKLTPTTDMSTPTPGNKYSWHQLLRSSDAMMTHLVPTDCAARSPQGLRARPTRSIQLTANQLGGRSCLCQPPRRFPNDPAPPSQCLRCSRSDRRKRPRIQQICSKFLLQKQK
jgi:hypothetical protein